MCRMIFHIYFWTFATSNHNVPFSQLNYTFPLSLSDVPQTLIFGPLHDVHMPFVIVTCDVMLNITCIMIGQ